MVVNQNKSCKGQAFIRMSGGLGNQMFQWAFARMIQETTDMDVLLDMSFFSEPYAINRPYQLGVFELEPIFVKDEMTKFKLDLIWKTKKFPIIARLLGMKLYREAHFEFDQSFEKISSNTYIEGFFQTEIYFKNIAEQLRKDFTFVRNPSKENREIISQIKNENSISVHIRRGDYVSKARYKNKYFHCSMDYYKRAVDYIAEKYPNPTVYVFSDDIKWAAQNLDLPYVCNYISNNKGAQSWEDMRLMSCCKHNVIANSSFSWWGAWLNSSPEKIVVAPEKWFQDDKIVQTDVIPEKWIKMGN